MYVWRLESGSLPFASWQLTAEDEAFLSENATATLSQFEKVTPNLGETGDTYAPVL